MSNYTKATDFAAKDTLPSGNPAKIVRGTEINTEFSAIQTAVNSKSDTASPTFTGTVSVTGSPPAAGTNTTQVATTAFVRQEISGLIDAAPSALDTLNELAAALADDANFSTTITSSIATRAPSASPTFTGTVTIPTLSLTTADTVTAASHYMVETGSDGIVRPKALSSVRTEIVTTAAVNSASATVLGTVTSGIWQGTTISSTYIDAAVARLAGPTFTGTVTVPTLSLTTTDTVTAASHYMVETGSDGVVRPKALSSVRTEIVTNTEMQTNILSPTAAGSNGIRKITMSTSEPTGGVDGDVWLVYV